MGSTQAAGMAQAVRDGDCTLTEALHYHLTANHYPPITSPSALEAAEETVLRMYAGEELDEELVLPSGRRVRRQDGTPVTYWEIAEAFHLWEFGGEAESRG